MDTWNVRAYKFCSYGSQPPHSVDEVRGCDWPKVTSQAGADLALSQASGDFLLQRALHETLFILTLASWLFTLWSLYLPLNFSSVASLEPFHPAPLLF